MWLESPSIEMSSSVILCVILFLGFNPRAESGELRLIAQFRLSFFWWSGQLTLLSPISEVDYQFLCHTIQVKLCCQRSPCPHPFVFVQFSAECNKSFPLSCLVCFPGTPVQLLQRKSRHTRNRTMRQLNDRRRIERWRTRHKSKKTASSGCSLNNFGANSKKNKQPVIAADTIWKVACDCCMQACARVQRGAYKVKRARQNEV